MNPTEGMQMIKHTHKLRPSQKWLLVLALLILAVSLLACSPLFLVVFGQLPLWIRLEVEAIFEEIQTPEGMQRLFLRLMFSGPAMERLDSAATGNTFELYGEVLGPPYPAEVELTWMPPPGASNFQFSGPQPEPGGPPFVWRLAVGPSGTTANVHVSYDPPEGVNTIDTFTLRGDGEETSMSVSSSPAAPAIPALADGALAPQDDYYLWGVTLWAWSETMTMTTDLCQDCADFLQSDAAFLAMRFPVYPPVLSPTIPYTLPIVFRGEYSPTLSLVQLGPYTRVFTAPLEYRSQYHTFAENELPSAPGEHWLALGAASSPTITCPQGLDLVGDDWLFEPSFYLDFGGVKGTCADCVLPFYYCYKGQELPASLARLHEDVTSYQGWGITCLGPHPLRLETPSPTPQFVLGGQQAAHITPTQTISFAHHVMNRGSVPVTVTLEFTSELGLNWGMYAGTFSAPDTPLTPITNPVALATGGAERVRYFWMIADVPEGTPSGAESLRITAADVSSPTLSTWTSDVLWVGDWVEPPSPPMPYRVYLPLILRQSND